MNGDISLRVAHIEKAFTALNMYYTWVSLGKPQRSPTTEEAIRHYIANSCPYTVRFFQVEDETSAQEGGRIVEAM